MPAVDRHQIRKEENKSTAIHVPIHSAARLSSQAKVCFYNAEQVFGEQNEWVWAVYDQNKSQTAKMCDELRQQNQNTWLHWI